MISRRLLRIKALTALYAFNRRDDGDLVSAEKELMFSIGKTYDLYHYILLLIVEMADTAAARIDLALKKKMPTWEDLNPNRRFADNPVISLIRINRSLKSYVASKKISWANNQETAKTLYNNMLRWKPYIEYMAAEKSSFASHRKFIIRMVTDFFSVSEELMSGFEEQSIFWNDDLEYVSAMVDKTLRKFSNEIGEAAPLMPLYKNEEDEEFTKVLFRKAILGAKVATGLIERNTTNWELERIALMDILVMQLAITEIMEFSEIPVKVTLNEYIEIAKFYCTSKSSTFVNGILDKVVREMKEKELFAKAGRGLIGDVRKDKD
jgi:N utilization substance protein B